MRKQRAHGTRSRSRSAYRGQIAHYMASDLWATVRHTWIVWFTTVFDQRPRCVVCGSWQYDLHHAEKARRFGTERCNDLIPLCRDHHEILHQLYDRSAAFRQMDSARATYVLIAHIRQGFSSGKYRTRATGPDHQMDVSWAWDSGWSHAGGVTEETGKGTVLSTSSGAN